MKIFICEDNALIALMLEDLVEDCGHEPCGIADSFDAALSGCRDSGAQLALVDLDLSDGATGMALVEALASRGLPSIIVSGQAAGVRSGHHAVAVLSKPVEAAALRRAIARLSAPGSA